MKTSATLITIGIIMTIVMLLSIIYAWATPSIYPIPIWWWGLIIDISLAIIVGIFPLSIGIILLYKEKAKHDKQVC